MFHGFCLYLLFLPSLWLRISSSKSVFVGYQLDGKASTDSFLHYKGTIPRLQKFSLCVRWQILQLRDDIFIMSYVKDDYDNEMILELYENIIKFECCNLGVKILLSFDIKLDKIDSMCLGLNLAERYVTAVVNGKVIKEKEAHFYNSSEEALYVKGDGSLILGQDQDFENGGYNKHQSFRGYIIDFSLINRLLGTLEMVEFTNCSNEIYLDREDVVCDFSNIQETFEASNVSIVHKDFDPNFCHSNTSFISFIPGLRTFSEAMIFCHSVGGEVMVPRNAEENSYLFNYLDTYKSKCKSTYTAISWLGTMYNKEGYLGHYRTGYELSFTNMKTNITSNTENRCVVIYGSRMDSPIWFGMWEGKSCTKHKTCVTCVFQEPKKLYLRGLCEDSDFDRSYYLTVENGTEYFRGEKFSFIRFFPSESENEKLGQWKLYRMDTPLSTAIMVQQYNTHYPIGRNTWQIDDDSCKESKDELFLTFCGNDKFACNDGSCVPLDKRCDLQLDCSDYSDEFDCLPLILPKNYSDQIPAPKLRENEPLRIKFFLNIHSVKDFNLKGFSFVTEISLTLMWKDSRLKFKNLKDNEDLNLIDKDKELPWIPQYLFEGGQNSSCEITIPSSKISVRRDSTPLPDSDEFILRDEIYLGSENHLVLRRKFTLKTSCQFDLADFPFDIQICRIHLIPAFPDLFEYEPIDEGMIFSGNPKLLEYTVKDVKLLKVSYGPTKVNAIEFNFRGLSSYYISNTYTPTLILLIIGHLPFYFSIEDFSNRIVVAVTSLLVEAAFFSQLGEIMPHTSYLTMLDVWCLFCIVIIFLISLLLAIINYLHVRNTKERKVSPIPDNESNESQKRFKLMAEHLNIFGRILIPFVVVVFLFSYIIHVFN